MTDLRHGTGPEPRSDEWAKLACGCYAAWDGYEWLVTATAFTCDHKQGDHADGAPPNA